MNKYENNNIIKYLGPKGYSILKSSLSIKEQKQIKKNLTVKPFSIPGSLQKVEPFMIYRESPKKLYIPRFYGIEKYGLPEKSTINNGEDIKLKFNGTLRDYQVKIVNTYLNVAKEKGGGLIDVACGFGKCLAYNTPVMMYNGTIKKVQNIQKKDKLMGDDGKQRKVLNISRGKEMMYKIIQEKADNYTVNESHILSLFALEDIIIRNEKKNKKYTIKANTIIDINIKDYLNLKELMKNSKKYKNKDISTILKGFKVKIDFLEQEIEYLTTPYRIGCIAGELSKDIKMRKEIFYIPDTYKKNTFDIRRQVLAGIIDTIGKRKYNTYKLLVKNEILEKDIFFIVNTLGLRIKSKIIDISTNSKLNTLSQGENKTKLIIIYGEEVHKIPVKKLEKITEEDIILEENYSYISNKELNEETNEENDKTQNKDLKQKTKPSIIKNYFINNTKTDLILTNIKVEKYKEDNYYGFEIDGNRRFLLGDCTVTHNTVMALNIISRLQKKTLIIVHKEFLLNQWIERINQYLPDARVGKIQGKIIDTKDKDIVIGMLQSLSMKDYSEKEFQEFGLTIVDECHHIAAAVFSNSLFKIVTNNMLGLSATMDRKDGLTHVFKKFIGDVCYKLERNKDEDNVLVRVIQYDSNDKDYRNVIYNYKGHVHYSAMLSKICEYQPRSEMILKILKNELEYHPKQQIMILAHNKSILKYLYDNIVERNIASVGYYIGGMKEKDLKETESKQVVIATYAMAEEALDIKSLSALILATSKKDVVQAVGRILRTKHENNVVYDIVDSHELFQKQYKHRRRYYTKCNYKILETDYENEYCRIKEKDVNPLEKDDIWDTIFDPENMKCAKKKKKQIEKLKKKDTENTMLQGKCLLNL